jgi:hypothetical protein
LVSQAKGKGGEQALKLVEGVAGLDLVLVVVPFFYSNFLAFFTPLPNQGRTQWELAACFGDGSTKIDMMNVSDLGVVVRKWSSKTIPICCGVGMERNGMECVNNTRVL